MAGAHGIVLFININKGRNNKSSENALNPAASRGETEGIIDYAKR
jgi:hypothetical protein